MITGAITAECTRMTALEVYDNRFNNTFASIMESIQSAADNGCFQLNHTIKLVSLDQSQIKKLIDILTELGYDIKYDNALSVSWYPPLDV